MTERTKVGLMAAAAIAMVLAGPLAATQAQAGKKSKIKCKIDGETFKTNTRGGGAGGTYQAPIDDLLIAGGRGKFKGRNPATILIDTRAFAMRVLPIADLTTATFPLVVPVDSTSFAIGITRGVSIVEAKLWEGEGVTMTITSFDGTRIKGTAEGTIPALEGTDTAAVVEGCKFSVLLDGAPTLSTEPAAPR